MVASTTYFTDLWKEIPRQKDYRIQTNDPGVIRKLSRRKTVYRFLAPVGADWVLFRLQYQYTAETKRSFKRLTGDKGESYKEPRGLYVEKRVIAKAA